LGGYSPVLAVGVGSKGGLATEAARAVLDDALASGIGRVWATIRPHNTASLRVAAKIGMTPRHTRPDSRGPLVYLARP
jgi:RimJ/RimL family protein N-acetyltransferase